MTSLEHLPDGRIEIGTRRFPADEIIAFAGEFDPQVFHLDPEGARETVFGGLCASGWHTTAAWLSCAVESVGGHESPLFPKEVMLEWGTSPGVRNLRWTRPVFAGETIRFFAEIAASRPIDRQPGWHLLRMTGSGETLDGKPVLTFTWSVACRSVE